MQAIRLTLPTEEAAPQSPATKKAKAGTGATAFVAVLDARCPPDNNDEEVGAPAVALALVFAGRRRGACLRGFSRLVGCLWLGALCGVQC